MYEYKLYMKLLHLQLHIYYDQQPNLTMEIRESILHEKIQQIQAKNGILDFWTPRKR